MGLKRLILIIWHKLRRNTGDMTYTPTMSNVSCFSGTCVSAPLLFLSSQMSHLRKLHSCCLFIFPLLVNKSTASGAWFLEGHTYLKSWSHPTRVAGWPGSPTWGQAVAYSSLGAFWCYMAITPAAVPGAGFVADGQPSRSVATLLAPAVYPLRNSEEETTKKKTKKTSKRGKGNAN